MVLCRTLKLDFEIPCYSCKFGVYRFGRGSPSTPDSVVVDVGGVPKRRKPLTCQKPHHFSFFPFKNVELLLLGFLEFPSTNKVLEIR